MLQRIVFTVCILQAVKIGVFSTTSDSESNICMDLIRKGGNIACEITGEGDYYDMSISNCWISCRNGSNRFLLPHQSCERILDPEYWAAYQYMTHELPPFGFQDCDNSQQKRLNDWVDEWNKYKQNSKTFFCNKLTR
uniref:Putative ixodes 10 kDa peptide protein n=1 Tax=Ixodes ricinus TaxID=34613 RepID=A0A0K8RBG0_IXORI